MVSTLSVDGSGRASPRDLLLGVLRQPDPGYDEAWHRRFGALQMAAIESYFAHSDSWSFTPSMKRYREIPHLRRPEIAKAFGTQLGLAMNEVKEPILCIERPYIDGFVAGLQATISVPFVLLVVNGGDAPLTPELQEQIESLDLMRACFANNLQNPRLPDLFFPLPLGLTSETLLEQVRQNAKPWELRDRRLLVAPMRLHNRLRKRYLDALADKEYADVVHIVSESLPYEAFLVLVSQHRSILSPPGRGYDCGRTWQALALGTVPLVARDEAFDQRLFEGGPSYMPAPEDLSPELLFEVLARLTDPAEHLEKLTIRFWKDRWRSCFS